MKESEQVCHGLRAVRLSRLIISTGSHAHFFSVGNSDPKVGQTDLVSGLRSGFTIRLVHAGLQVSVCSGYD